jgi:hypothetical protein
MANNRWTNFVREWAVKNGLTYGCALSDPAMREEYKVKYGNRKRLTQTKEKEMMGQEDKDAIELVIEEVAPKKGKKGRPAKYATAEEARQAKIKNTIEARKRKKQGQKELGLEAKEAEMMGKEDINRARKKVMKPPSGPPPISAEMVKAVKAKVATDKMEEYKVNAVRTKMTKGEDEDRFFKFLIKEAEKQGQSSPRYVARLIFNMTGGNSFLEWIALDNDKEEVREALGENMSIKIGEFEVRGDEETTTITPDLLKLIKSAQKKDFIDVEYDFIKRIADVSNKGEIKMMRPFKEKEKEFPIIQTMKGDLVVTESNLESQELKDELFKLITEYKYNYKTAKAKEVIKDIINLAGAEEMASLLKGFVGNRQTSGKRVDMVSSERFVKRFTKLEGSGFNPLPEFAEQVKGAESGGGIQHLPDGCVLYTGGSPLDRQIGGHWTEQMKPHLEKELRNYQNIVHHLGQHLSESGQKDPKDAMGYSHYGNEMRRIKQLLSTI